MRIQRRFALVPESVTEARRWAAGIGDRMDSSLMNDLRLILSELVTNAVKYSASEGSVSVRLEASPDCVRGEVEDPGEGFEPPRILIPEPEQDGGRGLFVVDCLAGRWGVRRAGSGTSVWFEINRAAPR